MVDFLDRFFGGPLKYRGSGALNSNFFTGLPLDVVSQVGADGLGGLQHYFNHFIRWEGPLAEGAAAGWLLSGTTGTATITFTSIRSGEIVLTADATGSCNPTLQLGASGSNMPFIYSVGKRMWMAARFKLVTVATTEVFLGMGTADTSPCTTGTFPSDGIFFQKASTDTKMSFDVRKDGTSTSRASLTGTLVDATYTILGFNIDTSGNVHIFQDGTEISASMVAAGTANLPGSGDPMQFMIGILGASMTMTLDWVLAAQEV